MDLDADTDTDPVNLTVEDANRELQIQDYLDKTQLEEIHKIFEAAPKYGFKKADFKSKVLSKFKIELSDENYETFFTRLNFNKNDFVTWDEFVTFLALELECKAREMIKSVSIENPIVDEPQIINSRHRSAIIHIMFSPSVRLNGTIDYEDGKYMSMSKDGFLNVWSLDLKLLRTYKDKSLYPSARGTWVTNFVCLPDMNVLVTSSTERELRFYDTTSKRFNLIIVFIRMPFCVNHMHYHFSDNLKDESILVCGDLGGNIRIMQFSKEDKGPFKQKIGVETFVLKWDQICKGGLSGMKAYNVLNVHTDWVRQVSYYKLLGSIVSCSTSPNAMFLGDFHGSKTSYLFYLKRGIETFCCCEDSPLIVTGSLDCILRLWNPFITTKPISMLRGHHASIVKIFLQDQGQKIFSLDKDRFLKVWESISQTCIQTYSGFAFESGPIKEFSAYYNERNHLFIVGGFKIASTTCGKLVDEVRSDGETHCGAVSIVLYNKLFKCVITCGLDSNIVIWDLWTNKSKTCIRKAHYCVSMGVQLPLPITAATLDPPHQFLLTGCTDGTIKMWDFNAGVCLRNMDVGKNQEVTKLIWLKNRILAVGWNCRVVEFADSLTGKVSAGKAWELRHTNDILSADYRPGQALATGTYNGDLIFWRLETGQSYKRYNVTHPTGLLKLEYIKEKIEKKPDAISASSKGSRTSSRKKKDMSPGESPTRGKVTHTFSVKENKPPTRVLLAEKVIPSVERNLAVHCLIFLKKRETLPDQATLMTATENGMIQAWSHHPSGSFITAFRAVHIEKDYVACMTTDSENEFLFTGTIFGYVKIWLIKNYCLTPNVEVDICMPMYRLQFPFLIKDRIRTRAKSALQNQPSPLLLSSYKGHLWAVLYLEYIQECKILLTASADKTVRVWTLSGRYIGCLGQNKPWLNIEWGTDPEKTNAPSDFRIPPDLIRNGSYTSLKVFKGAPPIVTHKYDIEIDLSISEEEKKFGVYGKKLEEPFLGKNHSFPIKLARKKKLRPIDETMLNIPVFTHLILSSWKPIERKSTPECIRESKNRSNAEVLNREAQDDSLNFGRKPHSNILGKTGESYSASWKIISEKVEQILNPDVKTIVTFEPLYSRVYRNACNGFSSQMHIDLITLCSKHLHGINQKLCSHNEISVEHLLKVHQDLRSYLLSVKIISSVFSYLNKFYVAYYLKKDLFMQLSSLFSQIIINDRISTLMGKSEESNKGNENIVEESLKIPFSIPPEVLHNFFNELHQISNGEYSKKYLHLFSRYCPNVLPPMKESDIENHISEIYEFKKKHQHYQSLGEKHGVKRSAEEPLLIKPNLNCQLRRTYPMINY